MLNLVANGPSGYTLSNSLRFRASASAYLNRTPGSTGNQKTWTWSGWVKRGALSGGTQYGRIMSTQGSFGVGVNFMTDDTLRLYFGGSSTLQTTQVFRDPSAWYHIVVALDTTQATAANRVKLYVNGTQVTAFSSATYPNQNDTFGWNNSSIVHQIGASTGDGATAYLDGYQTEINAIDGQALTPSSFGSTNSTTGVWQPAKYTGTYGTNGFYLNFNSIALTSGSNTGLGKDSSGNGNYWNTNNISVTAGATYDAMTDVPTLTSATVGNYATLNPLAVSASTGTCSNGNLTSTGINVGGGNSFGTIALPTSGKFYWEVTPTNLGGNSMIGVSTVSSTSSYFWQNTDGSIAYYSLTGNSYVNNSSTAYGATYTTNDIIGVAIDLDAGSVTYYKNNTSQGAITFNASALFPAVADASGSGASTFQVNFGQRPFSYTPPTGFVALNTYNLPTPTILQGNKYMDATLYTGNLTGQSITNAASFKPDLVWIKSRSAATDNKLTDSVRGATIALVSNSTAAETTDLTGMTAFNTNGFTLGASTTYNNTGATYVGWQWQAGQGSTSSNTSGSITSTVSVNATAGFSVVKWTGNGTVGATVGHGLGVAPAMIIVKDRSLARSWPCYHKSIGNTGGIDLNSTGAASTGYSQYWNNTSPTSSVFSVSTFTNENASNYVTYFWAEIAGYSKAFSYTGNGSTDGSFVYTGFLPRFVLIKRTDTTGDWYMWDTARNTYDVITNTLLVNSSAAETSATSIDALSNGFKLRNTTAGFNASGGTYIGMAWATNPFKNSNAF